MSLIELFLFAICMTLILIGYYVQKLYYAYFPKPIPQYSNIPVTKWGLVNSMIFTVMVFGIVILAIHVAQFARQFHQLY